MLWSATACTHVSGIKSYAARRRTYISKVYNDIESQTGRRLECHVLDEGGMSCQVEACGWGINYQMMGYESHSDR